MLAVLFGLLMVASIDGPRPFQRNHNEHVPLGRVGHTGVMGDLTQQGGGGSRKSVGAEELGGIGSFQCLLGLGHNQRVGVSKQMAANCIGVEA